MKFPPTPVEFIGATTASQTPQLAPAPSSQTTRARTYCPTNNPPSHDRSPSTTTSYILEIDRSNCDSEVA